MKKKKLSCNCPQLKGMGQKWFYADFTMLDNLSEQNILTKKREHIEIFFRDGPFLYQNPQLKKKTYPNNHTIFALTLTLRLKLSL